VVTDTQLLASAIRRVGFWVGWLELGFVLYAATWMSELLFVFWSGSGCIALMFPRLSKLARRVLPGVGPRTEPVAGCAGSAGESVGRAKPLPKSAAERGLDAQVS
jgi:hypothetical protein